MKASKIAQRSSKIHGNGVFATAPIKKGEEIVEYKGKMITHAEADALHFGDIDTGHTFLFTLNEEYILDANTKGNVARWINHSCDPNAIAFVHGHESEDLRKDRVLIEALRDIKAGEEITYDYGFEFDVPYTKELKEIWACRCGSPKCIGTMLKPKKAAPVKAAKAAKKAGTKSAKKAVKK
jgi:SET domain-containing protein